MLRTYLVDFTIADHCCSDALWAAVKDAIRKHVPDPLLWEEWAGDRHRFLRVMVAWDGRSVADVFQQMRERWWTDPPEGFTRDQPIAVQMVFRDAWFSALDALPPGCGGDDPHRLPRPTQAD